MWSTMALGVVRASAVSWNKVTGALHLRVLLNRLLKKTPRRYRVAIV